MKINILMGLLVLLSIIPNVFGETLDYSIIFVNIQSECSDRNYQSLEFYETIVDQYLSIYGINHRLIETQCVTSIDDVEQILNDSSVDLPIFVLDSLTGLDYHLTTGALGHYQFQGDRRHIVAYSFSPFIESDTGAWIMSHELSHFTLEYKGEPRSVWHDWVHSTQAKSEQCVNENLSLNSCPDLWTTVSAPSGKDIKVMKIYDEYDSQQDYSDGDSTKNPSDAQNAYTETKYDSVDFWKCRDYVNTEKYSQAITCYEKIIDDISIDNPDYSSALNDLARSYHKIGDHETSIEYYEELLDLKPNDFYSIVGLCYVYYDAGDYENAVKYGKRAISMKPNDSGATICYDYSTSKLQQKTSKRVEESQQKENRELLYGITKGKVISITADTNAESLLVSLETKGNGVLSITLPREVIDARNGPDGKSGQDVDFFVLVDGLEVDFEETTASTVRTLTILFEDGTTQIEIIGTKVIPKFKIQNVGDETTEEYIQSTKSTSTKGGCLIATAAFDSELAPQVQHLRELRDNSLLKTESGSAFMTGFNDFYYSFSPTIADWERQNPVFKEAVKITITPMLSTLSILNYVNIDSEQAMLGYGIGIILLNVGMYLLFPIFLVTSMRRRL